MYKITQRISDFFKEHEVLYTAGSLLLDSLYPRRCPVCEKILTDRRTICVSCMQKLPWIREPYCRCCGRPVEKTEQELCRECLTRGHFFREARSAFLYEGRIREIILEMKFQNKRVYLDFLAEALAAYSAEYLSRIQPDLILPVPMHRQKTKERGFDQCRLLADKLSGLTGILSPEDVVVRTRYTIPQKGLARSERHENLKGAFTVCRPEYLGKTVLLIDDIFTTGSTLDELSRTILRSQMDTQIYVLTVCIVRGKQEG